MTNLEWIQTASAEEIEGWIETIVSYSNLCDVCAYDGKPRLCDKSSYCGHIAEWLQMAHKK